MSYDPNTPPNPAEWLALDEAERNSVIEAHHRRAKIRSGSLALHAGIDAAVETQLAGKMPVTVRALERLMQEGVDRSEAVHAIASAIAEEMYVMLKEQRPFEIQSYGRRLEALDAGVWGGKGHER